MANPTLYLRYRFGLICSTYSPDPVLPRGTTPVSLVHKEVKAMLGMSLLSFLVLTLISAVVAVVYHNVLRYRFLDGNDALVGKLIVGWFGAWLGSPILGYWLWKVDNVYVVPAILGAIVAIHLNVLAWKALAKLAMIRITTVKEEVRPMKTPIAA